MKHLWVYLLLVLSLHTVAAPPLCSGNSAASAPAASNTKGTERQKPSGAAKSSVTSTLCSVSIPVKVWAMHFEFEGDPSLPVTKGVFSTVMKSSPSGIVQLPEPVLKNLVALLQSNRLLNSTPGKNRESASPIFDESQVRMLVELNKGEEVAWVDNRGTVQYKATTFRLSSRDFHDLKTAVDEWYSKILAEALRTHVAPNKK